MLLYRSIAGSRLYGTHRPDSDWDWVEIYTEIPGRYNRRPMQTIVGDQDTTAMTLSTLMRLAEKGAPQLLEIMFTPNHIPEVDKIQALRNGFVPNLASARRRYTRKIDEFAAAVTQKHRNHAVRLERDLESLLATGRFDPTRHGDTL